MGQCQGNNTTSGFKAIIEDVPGTKQPGYSSIYRKVGITNLEWRPAPHITTVHDIFKNSVKEHGSRPAVGISNLIKVMLM